MFSEHYAIFSSPQESDSEHCNLVQNELREEQRNLEKLCIKYEVKCGLPAKEGMLLAILLIKCQEYNSHKGQVTCKRFPRLAAPIDFRMDCRMEFGSKQRDCELSARCTHVPTGISLWFYGQSEHAIRTEFTDFMFSYFKSGIPVLPHHEIKSDKCPTCGHPIVKHNRRFIPHLAIK